ncbi:MAG: ATP-binding protein [Pricia sp.]|nr:ATP-binding protein [Pricia sp.]
MLVKFTVGNYLSFKDRVSIDFNATSLTEYRSNNIMSIPASNINLLKSVILFGANSSGKSNLFKAIKFVRRFIQGSSKDSQADEKINVEPFRLSTESLDKPSYFEIEFILDGKKYRYGFEVDDKIVLKEWLFSSGKTKEYLLFERGNKEITIGSKFNKSSENIIDITRNNALFLSVCAQFNIEIAIEIIKEMGNLKYVSGTNDHSTIKFTVKLLNDPKYSKTINNFIKGARLGFNEVETEKIEITSEMLSESNIPKELHKIVLENNDDKVIITTKHTVFDNNLEPSGSTFFDLMSNESLGTRKLFSLAGPIVDTIIHGRTLIIDEFDARLHPILAKAIIQLFNSSENKNAQILFASHNSHFINSSARLFRRDQVLITEKDFYGVTRIESLYDKKIRKDASFEKDYLSGKYDGVPIKLEINSQLDLFG